MTILNGYILSLVFPLLCLALALLVYKIGLEKKYTRKLVHILIGFEWCILYFFFGATYHSLVICLVFLCIMALTYIKNLMPMISSSGDNAPGTVYYCVSMTVMALMCLVDQRFMLPFGIAVFCTSVGDGMAGVVGQAIKKGNIKIIGNKTLFGCLSNFVFSTLVVVLFNCFYEANLSITAAVIIGFITTMLEAFTGKGLDNITIPLGVFSVSYMLIALPLWYEYIVPVLLTPIIVYLVLSRKKLTAWGTFAAALLDVIVSVAFGNVGFIILLCFLAFSIYFDKVKLKRLNSIDQEMKGSKKTECRGIIQVISNGIVPAICAVLYLFTKDVIWLICYICGICEAFSDTVSSSFGAFSKKTFDLFRFKTCEKGISGGMSVYGTLSSLIAPVFLASLGFFFVGFTGISFAVVVLCAFLGSFFDSFLGSLFQAKYRCSSCGKLVEKREHCGVETSLASGFSFINNSTVNLISNIFSVVICWLIYSFVI